MRNYGRDRTVIQIITDGGESRSTDQAHSAAEDEDRFWNNNDGSEPTPSKSNCKLRQSQSWSESEPPSKKSRNSNSQDGGGGGDGGDGKEIVTAHEDEREEFQIPALGSSSFVGEFTRRSNRDRHCRKFNSEQGCDHGDSCNFLHDEQSRNRESVAIILGPSGYSGRGGGGGSRSGRASVAGGGNAATAGNAATELHRYGGGFMEGESRDSASVATDSKQGVPSQRPSIVIQRPSIAIQRPPGQRTRPKWPKKLNGIYGDWIDDSI